MAIEGTGIKTPSKKASRMAMVTGGPRTPVRIDNVTTGSGSTFKRVLPDFGAGRVGDVRLKKAEADTKRPNYFSLGGGAFDERNNVQIASTGDSFDENDFKGYLRAVGIKYPRTLPDTFMRGLRENYQMDKKEGIYKDGQIFNRSDTLFNKAPVQEKPSFVEQTKNFAGNIFNTITGTQPAAASQIPGGMPTGTQFSSSNLDAARTTGDTSFASYRMGGGNQQQQNQQQSETVVSPTVKPQYEINRSQNRPSVSGAVNTDDTSFSAYVRGGGEGQQRGIVSPISTGAPRQTVASLPSDYKQTEAREFAKAETFQRAKKNPNVTVGVDSKGQPRVTAVQKTRDEAGTSARTAQGNQARVKQNAVARAQAAAYNRKLSGTKPKSAKERAQDAAKARKAAGPNRKMSAGQQTRSQAGASARTAQGNRARVRSNARKRAQAAARKRRAKKKSKKK